MSTEQFAKLATLINSLCDAIPTPYPESFATDRQWIPLPYYEELRKRVEALEAEREIYWNDAKLTF
jgi:hypothetical protein